MSFTREVNDVHVHLGKSSIINQKLLEGDISKFRRKHNINHIALMTLDRDIDKNNKTVIKLSQKHKFLHGLFWIQKNRISEDLNILKKNYENGIIGVKFHSVFEKKHVNSKVYEPILEFLNEKEAILLVHCGRFKDGHPDSTSSYVHPLRIAKKFAKIKVILAHMGGNDTTVVKKAMIAAKNIPNAYFDTSGISTPYRVEFGVKTVGSKRILFGSDYPWCSFRSMYYGVEDALISEEDKKLIFSKNFLKILP